MRGRRGATNDQYVAVGGVAVVQLSLLFMA